MTKRSIPDFTPDGLRKRLRDLERQVADLQRVRNPPPSYTEPAEVIGGGGGPWIVVAPYNATDWWKARADYICDGTADEVEINAAINDPNDGVLNNWQDGPQVFLAPGWFYLSTAVTLRPGTRLRGANRDDVWVYVLNGNEGFVMPSQTRIEHVGIANYNSGEGATGIRVWQAGCVVDNCWVSGLGNGVRIQAGGYMGTTVSSCWFTPGGTGKISLDDYGGIGAEATIENCYFENVDGIGFQLAGVRHRFTGNRIGSLGASTISGDHILVTDNYFENGHGGLTIAATADYPSLSGNWIYGGAADVTDSSATTQYGINFSAAGSW